MSKTYRLTIDVTYANEDTISVDPIKVLEAAANLVASDGMLTMETELEVEAWLPKVEAL